MRRSRRPDGRTVIGGVDPGLARLRLASVAVAAMVLAVVVTEVLRATVATGEPVTMLLFAGVLAMFANILVVEPTLHRRRVTTLLMVGPALVATVAGALLAPHRLAAIVVFVLLMALVVWLRRYGGRADALGTAAFIPFYSTQFLHTAPDQVVWLVVAALVGIGSTFLLRCIVFPERPERTLRRLVGAFTARAHALVLSVDGVLAGLAPERGGRAGPGAGEAALERMRRARDRLGQVALQVENQMETTPADRAWPGLPDATLSLRIFDAELALERLAVVTRDLSGGDQHPEAVFALRTGVARLLDALVAGVDVAGVNAATSDARSAVAGLMDRTDPGREGERRAAFAVRRLADAVDLVARDAPAEAHARSAATAVPDDDADADVARGGAPVREPRLDVATRQAVQITVAATLAIVVAETVAPQRWYWAVLTVFVVFTSTQSRGDLLTRGWLRVIGTAGGVGAGMAVATVVDGNVGLSLVLLVVGVFLALYLAGVSPALLAFWITTVLALLYGALGQFTPELIGLRLLETAIGAACSVVAAFLILPRGARSSLGDAVGEFLSEADEVLAVVADRVTARVPGRLPFAGARRLHAELATVRTRVGTVVGPWSRGRAGLRRVLRVLTVCDHYLRALARLSGEVRDPGWAATLDPTMDRVRENLAALGRVLSDGRRRAPEAAGAGLRPADAAIDVAEDHAASGHGPSARDAALGLVRLLRRVDQAVVGLGADLGMPVGPSDDEARPTRAGDPVRS